MRLWCLSHRRPANMKYGSRRSVRLKIRHLAPVDGCACAFEDWVYGGWKVPWFHEMARRHILEGMELVFCDLGWWKTQSIQRKPPTLDGRPLPCHLQMPAIEPGPERWQVRIFIPALSKPVNVQGWTNGPIETKAGNTKIHIFPSTESINN